MNKTDAKPVIITFENKVAASIFQKVKGHENVKMPNPTDNIEYMRKLDFIKAASKAITKKGHFSEFYIHPMLNMQTGDLVPRVDFKKPHGRKLYNVGKVFDAADLTLSDKHTQIIQDFLIECGLSDPETVEPVMKIFNSLDNTLELALCGVDISLEDHVSLNDTALERKINLSDNIFRKQFKYSGI